MYSVMGELPAPLEKITQTILHADKYMQVG
jgi:hypothetical protein